MENTTTYYRYWHPNEGFPAGARLADVEAATNAFQNRIPGTYVVVESDINDEVGSITICGMLPTGDPSEMDGTAPDHTLVTIGPHDNDLE